MHKAENSAEVDKLVFADSIRALRRPVKSSWTSMLIAAAVLAIALKTWYSWTEVGVWLAGLLLIQLGLRSTLFHPSQDLQVDELAQQWARYHLRGSALVGIYWGTSLLYFVDGARPEIQFYIALTLGGMGAGALAVLAFYRRMLVFHLVGLIAPFSLWCLVQGDRLHIYVGLGMLLLCGLLIFYGYAHARTITRMIQLRHENAALVEQLGEQTRQLTLANDAKARFFAAASHDLRQPLQALGYYSDLLNPNAQDANQVQRIRECVDSLDGLLEGVMTISRLDAGKVQSHLEAVDLSTLLQRLVTLYGGIASAKGLSLRARLSTRAGSGNAPDGRVWVRTDPLLLERVLGNLLSNALRYTVQGGVLLAARPWGGSVRLQVIDTGIGIPADQQDSIFEEFVQLNNPQRDDTQGVGLGLATVQRLCKLLDHPLALRSQPGRGSAFSLVLPGTAPAAPMPLPAVAGAQLQGRVLLVEDNDLVRESLQQTLQGWGLQVQAFAGAPAALQALASQRYDVVLSDWRLPGSVNGLDLLAQCGPLQASKCLCVLMTGEPVASLGTMPPGVTLLQKPVRPIRLRALLTAHLSPVV